MSFPDEDNHQFVRDAIRLHERPLLRYVARLLGDHDRARDVVQDSFIKLCRQDPARVADHLAAWLFTVARRASMDMLRKDRRVGRLPEAQVERITAVEPDPASQVSQHEVNLQVLSLLETLPAAQREVLRLKFQEGFSYQEIATITGLTTGNVGFILHTALTKLRREMSRIRAS
jgi:RNA polymerase sigma-70 factor (ECF subfamily)